MRGRRLFVFAVLSSLLLAAPAGGAVPGVGITLVGPASFTPGETLSFTGKISALSQAGIPVQTIDLLVDGVVVDSVPAAADGTFAASATLTSPPATHQVQAVAYRDTPLETTSPVRTVSVTRRVLTVTRNGTGSVSSLPAGISCPNDCTENVPFGDDVTLLATPGAGFYFGGYTGDCSGATCTVVMDQARNVTANFLPAPRIRFQSSSGTFAEDAGAATLTLVREGDLSVTSTIVYTTSDLTAIAGSDYTATSKTVQFNPGESSKTIAVPILEELVDEDNESFDIQLSNPGTAVIGLPSTATATVTDNDSPPGVGFAVVASSGAENQTPATVELVLSSVSSRTVTVNFATATGSATQGPDFAGAAGQVTFLPGQSSRLVPITLNNDAIDENDETFTISLSSPSNAVLQLASHTRTIVDDDAEPVVSFAEPVSSANEGELGDATVEAILSAPSEKAVTVEYQTSAGTATGDVDFALITQEFSFAPGQTSAQVQLLVYNDDQRESSEQFNVTLTDATNAAIGQGSHVWTIVDDDPMPVVHFASQTSLINEGATQQVIVSLNAVSQETVTVQYETLLLTASSSDLTLASGSLTFLPGETSKSFTITMLEDTIDEDTEQFELRLFGAVGATAGGPLTKNLVDNDASPVIELAAAASSGSEGSAQALISVSLSGATARTASVQFQTSTLTATSGDFTAASGTISFAPGETTKTIAVNVTEDPTDENDETFRVTLSLPTNATLGASTIHTRTILDNDDPPAVQLTTASSSGLETTTSFTVTISLSALSGRTVSVPYTMIAGTAGPGTDYVLAENTVTFAAGTNSSNVTFSVVDDLNDENDESFTIALGVPVNATLGVPSSHMRTIQDNDSPPTLAFEVVASSGTESITQVPFNVTLTRESGKTVTVAFATIDSSAAAPGDYTATSGTLTFNPGETTKPVVVTVANDILDEDNEVFSVRLSSVQNASLAAGATDHTRTIVDDDIVPNVSFSAASSTGAENGGPAPLVIQLSGPSGKFISVNVSTTNGSAVSSSDFSALTNVSVVFAPGETTKQASISINDDPSDENDESFSVALSLPSGSNVALGSPSSHVRTITDDDDPPTVSFSPNFGSDLEPDSASVVRGATVTLSAPSGKTVTVQFASADGTATAGSDYAAFSGTLTFSPGLSSQTITFSVIGDSNPEPNESFSISLSAPANATLGTSMFTYTIVNED